MSTFVLSPAVSAQEVQRLYPNAIDPVYQSISQGSFYLTGDVTALGENENTSVLVPFRVQQDGKSVGVTYRYNCATGEYSIYVLFDGPFNGTPFVEPMGLVRAYGNMFCQIDRGKR